MELIFENIRLVPFFPLSASIFLALGLFFFPKSIKKIRRILSSISIVFLTLGMSFSVYLFRQQITGSTIYRYLWSWVVYKNFVSEIGYLLDPLSSIMLVLVTTVAIMVMIYSDNYMFYDEGYTKFFCYLGLFTASMLGLILSPNLIQIYIFWELVGMCSYLLIGFWFTRPSASNACQKAFVINRIGDFGLLSGILGFYWITGSFDFQELSKRFFELPNYNKINIVFSTFCASFLFLGPVTKSAQFPLHIWLPDAMEGPTPISALIHAATMVAAGIYLVARMIPLFQMLPFVTNVISWTGVITALLGATIALAQTDLKKGLAYSTMSQLGYMMLALGIGSYKAALFHLITHAYSKALLSLGSGSVIHSMEPIVGYHPSKSQNMNLMGGLRQYMPITASTFLFGTFSLCGIPPFACFWSKDEILVNTWAQFPILGVISSFTAGLTAFYMFRIYSLIFEGNYRGYFSGNSNTSIFAKPKFNTNTLQKNSVLYPREANNIMLFPLILLAIFTLFTGFLGVSIYQTEMSTDFLSLCFGLSLNSLNYVNPEKFIELILQSIPSIIISLSGILIALFSYGSNSFLLRRDEVAGNSKYEISLSSFSIFLHNWSHYRGYIDLFYEFSSVRGFRFIINTISFVDKWIIDGIINAFGISGSFLGESFKRFEGGRISSYLFILVLPISVFFTFFYSHII
uniref:NAD(P)H-quinone oxidoreductase subunit 5, chloroplastic n=1 Tax=Cyathodium smaragdinum TaxID=2846787 RepID=A0A8F2XVR8_9MARC|nr:NADH dehydrogenase subunit 5 [Cyathodium smaragdinum]